MLIFEYNKVERYGNIFKINRFLNRSECEEERIEVFLKIAFLSP